MPTQTYLGNPNLKAKGVPVNFDKEHVKEYIKCSKNPVYFAKNYVKIIQDSKSI